MYGPVTQGGSGKKTACFNTCQTRFIRRKRPTILSQQHPATHHIFLTACFLRRFARQHKRLRWTPEPLGTLRIVDRASDIHAYALEKIDCRYYTCITLSFVFLSTSIICTPAPTPAPVSFLQPFWYYRGQQPGSQFFNTTRDMGAFCLHTTSNNKATIYIPSPLPLLPLQELPSRTKRRISHTPQPQEWAVPFTTTKSLRAAVWYCNSQPPIKAE